MNDEFDIEETEVEPRECGDRRDTGGLYMTGRMGKFGTPIETFFVDPFNFEAGTAISPDDMQMLVGDSSLGVKLFRRMNEQDEPVSIIVLDVIGKNNYTPASFLEELRHLGPSRKISTAVGEEIARYGREGIPFEWHFVFRAVLPDQENWPLINVNIKNCPTNRHKDPSFMSEGNLCSGWLYEMELPAADLGQDREAITQVLPSGYEYKTYPAFHKFNNVNSAVVCIIPGGYLRMESVVGDGEPNSEHKQFADWPQFKFVTE